MWHLTDDDLTTVAFKLRLLPLTLGHLFLLNEIACPLLGEREAVTHSDVVTFVVLCSVPHRDSRRLVSSRLLPWFIRALAWKNRKADLNEECQKAIDWLGVNLQTARTKTKPGSSKSCGAPLHWRLLETMLALGYSEPAAMDAKLNTALCLWFTRLEYDDRVNMMTKNENDLIDFVLEEKRKARNGVNGQTDSAPRN